MGRTKLNVLGQSYQLKGVQYDNQRCINWYTVLDKTGKFPTRLKPRPGLKLWRNSADILPSRGKFKLNNHLYVVTGTKFERVDANANGHLLGNLKTSRGNVTIVANSTQLFISDGKYGYVYQYKKNSDHKKGEFYLVTGTTSLIGSVTFTGSGLDDIKVLGEYAGNTDKEYRIEIDSTGTPDKFSWSNNKGVSWNETDVAITGEEQALEDSIKIKFLHTTGHTKHDYWDFDVTTNTAFYVPIIPIHQDGYGIYLKQDSGIFYISHPEDFSKTNALDFATAGSFPDNLVCGISTKEELWLMGNDSIEIWYDVGNALFPFVRRNNLIFSYGCVAPYSLTRGGNNVLFFLATNEDGEYSVVKLEDYQIAKISTEAISEAFSNFATVEDAVGWIENIQGTVMYVLTFPTEDKTFCYDLTVGLWHERTSLIYNYNPTVATTRQGRFRANWHTFINNKHLVGDYELGHIYEYSWDDYLDNGELITCEYFGNHLTDTLEFISYESFEIDVEKATSNTTGEYTEGKFMARFSINGRNFTKEIFRDVGKIGDYSKRVKWNRLGTGRQLTVHLKCTDPVFKQLNGAILSLEALEK